MPCGIGRAGGCSGRYRRRSGLSLGRPAAPARRSPGVPLSHSFGPSIERARSCRTVRRRRQPQHARHGPSHIGISDEALEVKRRSRREHDFPAEGRTSPRCGVPTCRRAPARSRGQRGAPGAARRGRTTLTPGTSGAGSIRNPGRISSARGPGHSGDLHQMTNVVVGQAEIGCRASLRAAQAHGALRPQPEQAQSQDRPRHRGRGHAEVRARVLAVPDLAHAAAVVSARQRISPSRSPK